MDQKEPPLYSEGSNINFRKPKPEDGYAVHGLVDRSPPLDTNSIYCNLLQCSHFADTCVLAELNDETVGFVSAYVIPRSRDALFIWQMVVDERVRGQGLAKRMLEALLTRADLSHIKSIETTITPDNAPSQAFFRKLAKRLNADLTEQVLFDREVHFGGRHDDEVLFKIGPFNLGENS